MMIELRSLSLTRRQCRRLSNRDTLCIFPKYTKSTWGVLKVARVLCAIGIGRVEKAKVQSGSIFYKGENGRPVTATKKGDLAISDRPF